MLGYITGRLLQGIVALFVLALITFMVAQASGDPVYRMLGPTASKEDVQRLHADLGLDQPAYVQFLIFIRQAATGDFGKSIRANRPVGELVKDGLVNSFKLSGVALLFAYAMGLPLGILAAVRKGTYLDSAAKVIATVGQSAPPFFIGIVLIELFAVHFEIFPPAGMGGLSYYVLPAFTQALFLMVGVTRLLRSSMLEILDSEFIKFARIKGVPERMVIWKHAFRNALIPVLTYGGIYFAMMITGAIVVETLFAWPGLGQLVFNATVARDFPLIQGVVLISGVLVIAVNLIIDIIYVYVDPRIRYN